MSKKNCNTCLYKDICESKISCKNYTPDHDEMSDTELGEYIENARREFYNEWWRYIDEDSK